MISPEVLNGRDHDGSVATGAEPQRLARVAPTPFRVGSRAAEEETVHRQAELFYLQKQIQAQTQMVIVLMDGEHIEGCIEWYDRRALKVRGRSRTLIYKSAIKYMYKLGDAGK